MNQKGLPLRSFLAEGGQAQVLILAGIVILIALAGGIFYLGRISAPKPQNVATSSPQPSPTPDPTANWKTYTNTKYGFSFKYPPSYMISETFTPDTATVLITNFDIDDLYKTGTKNPDDEDVFDMSIYQDLDYDTSLQKEREQYRDTKNLDGSSGLKYTFVDYNIDNELGFKVMEDATFPDGTKSKRFSIVTVHRNKRFSFHLRNQTSNHTQSFDQILSTFKFTQ